MKNYFFSYFLIFANINQCAPTIICDLFSQTSIVQGFKLLMENVSEQQEGSCLGATLSFGRYALSSFLSKRNPAELQNQLMELLNTMPVEKQITSVFYQGKTLPDILGYHLKNIDSNNNVINAVFKFIDQSKSKDKEMLKAAAQILFTPEQTAQSIEPSQEAINLLSDIKNLYPDATFILAANLKTFKPLLAKKSFEKFLNFFKNLDDSSYNVVCSGDISELKSSPAFFHRLVETYRCNREDTILIDSEAQHIISAQQAGIKKAIYWNQGLNKEQVMELIRS